MISTPGLPRFFTALGVLAAVLRLIRGPKTCSAG